MRDYNSKKPSKKMAGKKPQTKSGKGAKAAKPAQPAKPSKKKKPVLSMRGSSKRTVAVQEKSVKSEKKVKMADNLKVIPIGGLNEIGKNLTVLEYKDQILIIDCGLSFPEDEMYGIDVVIPDFNYLEKNANKILGLVITRT